MQQTAYPDMPGRVYFEGLKAGKAGQGEKDNPYNDLLKWPWWQHGCLAGIAEKESMEYVGVRHFEGILRKRDKVLWMQIAQETLAEKPYQSNTGVLVVRTIPLFLTEAFPLEFAITWVDAWEGAGREVEGFATIAAPLLITALECRAGKSTEPLLKLAPEMRMIIQGLWE